MSKRFPKELDLGNGEVIDFNSVREQMIELFAMILDMSAPLELPEMKKLQTSIVEKSKAFIKNHIFPHADSSLQEIMRKAIPYTRWPKA